MIQKKNGEIDGFRLDVSITKKEIKKPTRQAPESHKYFSFWKV